MTSMAAGLRPVWAEVDVAAVRHNTAVLRRAVAPSSLCAVVKADAYGHGAPAVARAALEAGATWLAVALVGEGVALRRAGIDGPPVLLPEPPPAAMATAVAARLVPTLYTRRGLAAAASAARQAGTELPVHVKVDTGMHRVGADPHDAVTLAAAVAAEPSLRLQGLWTHLAVAESPSPEDRAFTAEQVRRFDRVVAEVRGMGVDVPLVHAANSAGALVHPATRYDLVRAGIALYGELPSPAVADALARSGAGSVRPVLSWRARVSFVRDLPAGARPSYGRARPLDRPARVATVPVGYADGVPRRYFTAGGTVLVGGRRRPLAGTVTMDQILVDCGSDPVAVGDEVVLIGRQGREQLTAGDWAGVLGTISYEVLCGIGPRVPRVVVDGAAHPPDARGPEGAVPEPTGGGSGPTDAVVEPGGDQPVPTGDVRGPTR